MKKLGTDTLPAKKIITLEAAQALIDAAVVAAKYKEINYLVISVVVACPHSVAHVRS